MIILLHDKHTLATTTYITIRHNMFTFLFKGKCPYNELDNWYVYYVHTNWLEENFKLINSSNLLLTAAKALDKGNNGESRFKDLKG